ncbi:MAG: class I SAM-dependent methyltransferase [Candidatus Magasanikbacteria bacterium]|nr:class I SAM-dependent methyltransferase [Candidatus Magasanikbacteria bacterium]
MQEPWRDYLRQKKCVFSSYVHITSPEEKSIYCYQNDGKFYEHVIAIVLAPNGQMFPSWKPWEIDLAPKQGAIIDVGAHLAKEGVTKCIGSLILIVANKNQAEILDLPPKDLVSQWWSPVASSQIGNAGYTNLNVPGEKEKKSYFLFCPGVVSSPEQKTLIVIFNHSVEPEYNDTVTMVPKLHNLSGEALDGSVITIEPFGCAVISIDEYFGEAGKQLLAKTGGRGSLTMKHHGHTFSSYFFFVDRETNHILSARHTQPPALCVFRFIPFNYIAERIGSLVPFAGHIVPILSYIKHHPRIYRTFYPHHGNENYPQNLRQYLKQSRWVIWTKFMVRAVYFLTRKGFRIDEIALTDKTALNNRVIQHNLWNQLKLFQFSRGRVESMLYPLCSVFGINRRGKTLSIGPKNEGEILLFEAHGFTDVVGIDLFTYTPNILLMDAHHMTFADNTFDTIVCGWMIRYCYDAKQVAREIIRVAKDGAICLFSFGVSFKTGPLGDLDFVVTKMDRGIAELLEMFGPHVGHIYWWNEQTVSGQGRSSVVIFQIKKNFSQTNDKNDEKMISTNQVRV